MQLRGISLEDCKRIAGELGIEFQGSDTSGPRKGVEATGLLRPIRGSNPYQRISANAFMGERKVAAICWHGHRDFMRRVLEIAPHARISSMFATYQGAEDFERNYQETGYRNIGSLMYPCSACEACSCNESGMAA